MFLKQDYPDKELCILMDIPGYTKDMDTENRIWQWGVGGKLNIGTKRNILCHYAKTDIILHMDDDDSYSPDWITRSVEHLISSNADVTGLNTAVFRDLATNDRYQYVHSSKQPFVLGATFCYWRRVWEQNKFPNIQTGEDAKFLCNAGRILPHNYVEGFEASIHAGNTSKRHVRDKKVWRLLTNP